ncbi:MAG: alpha/beta hydrolase [Lachnospiraceae bacterium]|nr:alpha/beta hydrolase [Lachnospiraceae bacterium]
MIVVSVAGILLLLFVISVYIMYRICFGEFRENYPEDDVEQHMPKGPAYTAFKDVIERGIRNVIEEKAFEVVEITSVDGLTLRGRYYHRKDGAPLVIFFHGYHGNFYRDGNGIYSYAKKNDINLLLASQRSQGLSEGKTITFGIMERHDCKSWVEYAVERFGRDVCIDIFGLSMGGATVMMAADMGLPDNVRGILTDCGFSSPKEILCAVIDSLKLPSKLMYPLAKLGAKWFGHFNLEEASAVESMKNCNIPVLFVHNEGDDFVPFWMSEKCFEACASKDKRFVRVQGVGHGLSWCLEPEKYQEAMEEFFEKTQG